MYELSRNVSAKVEFKKRIPSYVNVYDMNISEFWGSEKGNKFPVTPVAHLFWTASDA